MSNNELYKKYLGDERPSHVYYKANLVDVPYTEHEIELEKNIGEEVPENPTAKTLRPTTNAQETWEQFVNFWAQSRFEECLLDFLDHDRNVRRESLEFELNEIIKFIDKANKTVPPSKACARPNSIFGPKPDFYDHEEEYIRLSNGYYEEWHEELTKGRAAGEVYGKYFIFKQWLEDQLNIIIPQNNANTKKGKPQSLYDIWLTDRDGSDRNYHEFIDLLKIPYPEIDSSFLTEIKGDLHWNKNPKKGWATYLASFLYTCIKKNWIKDDYSGTDYQRILVNTFNVSPDKKTFESLGARTFDEKYLKPFKNLPSNT